jgi:PleD family two-component response regulator
MAGESGLNPRRTAGLCFTFPSPQRSQTLMQAPNKTYRILVIEDNPTDVGLIAKALTKHGVEHEMVVLSDGEKALRYLDN